MEATVMKIGLGWTVGNGAVGRQLAVFKPSHNTNGDVPYNTNEGLTLNRTPLNHDDWIELGLITGQGSEPLFSIDVTVV